MIFRTQSGSVYEVDNKNKRVRRVTGEKDPTVRQGKDGEWKAIDNEINPVLGMGVLFIWNNMKANTPGHIAATTTNIVVEIIEDAN